jgi:hypothetical protein
VRRSSTRRRLAKGAAAVALVYGVVLAAGYAWSRRDVPHRPCPDRGVVVLVDSEAHVLCLCRDGRVARRFRVALGRGGVDKRLEGDGRTPLGRYGLGAPRPSRRFHVFIPVAFPTDAQRRAGVTGSDVGVHGPHLAFAWLRQATVWLDWTRGCIAVGTPGEADAIAAWVRANDPVTVWIL